MFSEMLPGLTEKTAAIGEILGRADRPQTRRELRVAGKELEEACSAGVCFRWPGARFWNVAPEAYAERTLLEALSTGPGTLRAVVRAANFRKLTAAFVGAAAERLAREGRLHVSDGMLSLEPLPDPASAIVSIGGERPLLKPELVDAAARVLPHLKRSAVSRHVDELIHQGVLQRYGKLCFARPADALRFLENAAERTVREWREVLARTGCAAADPAETLLLALHDLEPQKGHPVAVRKLRQYDSLGALGKEAFDRAARALVRRGDAFPFHHTAAGTLAAEERDALVDDGAGNYYVGLGWRS